MPPSLRYRILCILVFVIVLISERSGLAQASSSQQLNQEGFEWLHRGMAVEALQKWEQAEESYRSEEDKDGVVGTQLNQAIAHMALGSHPRACLTIIDALEVAADICEKDKGRVAIQSALSQVEINETNTIGIRLLGQSFLLLGYLEEARAALDIVITLSESSLEIARSQLALGDTHQSLFKEAVQTYRRLEQTDIVNKELTAELMSSEVEKATEYYRQVTRNSDSALSTQARLNLVRLFLVAEDNLDEISRSSASIDIGRLEAEAVTAYQSIRSSDFSTLPYIDSIYSRLGLASSLLEKQEEGSDAGAFNEVNVRSDIEALVTSAVTDAESLDNPRVKAVAYEVLADLHMRRNETNLTAPIALYKEALSSAQSVRADDVSFQLAYKLAKQYELNNQNNLANEYYQQSIVALDSVREDLIAVNSELRFSFEDRIQPVYKDYIRFLFSQEDVELERAISVYDSLQLAQLENILRCGRLVSDTNKVDKTLIHVINLGSTIEVVIFKDDKFYGYSIPAEEVLIAAANLSLNTQSIDFLNVAEEEFIAYSHVLYDKLLRPAQEDGLLVEGTELSFVLDTPFQSMPMALLHDGQQYLVSKHPVSLSLQTNTVVELEHSSSALFVGISELAPSSSLLDRFSSVQVGPLPETEYEADYVEDYARSNVLIDGRFTTDNLEKELSRNSFEVVHISTHGQFSSIPEETFLLAWDKPMDLTELGRLFSRAQSIDLLFLSACETAAGDDRATLGLAGLAIQSGASNAIATLWSQNSTGSTLLVSKFYEALEEGMSKAEALQFAQRTLMASTAFSHPYYWAPFILASS